MDEMRRKKRRCKAVAFFFLTPLASLCNPPSISLSLCVRPSLAPSPSRRSHSHSPPRLLSSPFPLPLCNFPLPPISLFPETDDPPLSPSSSSPRDHPLPCANPSGKGGRAKEDPRRKPPPGLTSPSISTAGGARTSSSCCSGRFLPHFCRNNMNAERKITCQICLEEMDVTDRHLQPCKCGYEICLWCWHHIMDTSEKGGTEATCPACCSPYDKERILQKTISSKRLEELKAEKRLKQQKSKSKVLETRAHLGSCRVIRRNLVYLAGLPVNIAEQKILQKKEFLGQYGKVLKVVMTKADRGPQQILSTNSCSVFVTFSKDEEAVRCIQALDGFVFYGSSLRASFGTSKYCEAWLKNMPCENPHCVYIHDAGRQEDICTRKDLMPVCASKIRQSCGIPFDNTQRRSGKFFPPPVQSFCSNTAKKNSVITNPMLCHHIPCESERSICPDGGDLKCGNFDEASRSSIVSSTISSTLSTPTIQGTTANKPTMRSHLPCSGGVLGNTSPVNFWQRNGLLSMEHNWPTVEINSVVEGFTNESTYIRKRTGEPFYASCGPFQQSNSVDGDIVQYPSLGDTAASLLHPLNSTTSYSESSFVGGQTVACRLYNYSSFIEATSSCLEPSGSASQDILSNHQQYTFLGRESMRSTDNLEAKNTFPSESENRKLSASYERCDNHIMDNEAANSYRPASIIGPKSSSVYQNLSDVSSVHKKKDLELCCADNKHQIASLEKHMLQIFQNACVSDEVKRDATEEKIISDILSLDLDLDDFSLDDDLGKLLDIDDGTVCSNLISSWKSRNNNVSKFCFATVDSSAKATKQKLLLGPDECKYDVSLNKLELLKNYSDCNTQSFHNLTISDDVFSKASPPLLPQAIPASRLTHMNRPFNFRPHDFFPHYASEDHTFPMRSDSDSSELSQHAGNSLHSSHSLQVAAENCCN